MATVSPSQREFADSLELSTGDRLSRGEFHRLYERAPVDFRAELIGGIVYVSLPRRRQRGTSHTSLSMVFAVYESRTPGVEAGDNATILLGDEAEPQPDLFLRVLPAYGGQSRTSDDDYVLGPPELVGEIALSSRAIDLHAKRNDYIQAGVLEYLVWCLREQELRWFDLRTQGELSPDADGVLRVRAFPGLWIHVESLLHRDGQQLLATLEQGLASPEHAAFVARLEESRKNLANGIS